jgi:hypothetical protein
MMDVTLTTIGAFDEFINKKQAYTLFFLFFIFIFFF